MRKISEKEKKYRNKEGVCVCVVQVLTGMRPGLIFPFPDGINWKGLLRGRNLSPCPHLRAYIISGFNLCRFVDAVTVAVSSYMNHSCSFSKILFISESYNLPENLVFYINSGSKDILFTV